MGETISTTCCIAGGGPAGMMLGFLLARAGVKTTVLEKHSNFLRDFRGDTIHPSTLELMHELGLLDAFLALPHHKAQHLSAQFGERNFRVADFSHLPAQCGYIAFMPQWDFLNFLSEQGKAYADFDLRMEAEVTEIIEEDGRVVGVRAEGNGNQLTVNADLVVAADGRGSIVREQSGLELDTLGAPMDVLWFSLPCADGDPQESIGSFAAGLILIMIRRTNHWQCGYVIPKDSRDALESAGIDSLRAAITKLAPFVADRIDTIESWDEVKLLTVAVNRLRTWHRPGLLLIGDAAHAMSPIGGVGVNLAIQDAVASANLLAKKLRVGAATQDDLAAVQKRREWPTRVTQRLQIAIQNRVIKSVLGQTEELSPPLPLRMISRIPLLQRIPARLVGLGVRPEHVESEAVGRKR